MHNIRQLRLGHIRSRWVPRVCERPCPSQILKTRTQRGGPAKPWKEEDVKLDGRLRGAALARMHRASTPLCFAHTLA